MNNEQLEAIIRAAVEQAIAATQTANPETLPFDTEAETPNKRVHKNEHVKWTNEKMALVMLLHDLGYTANQIAEIAKLGCTKWAVNNRLQTIQGIRIEIDRDPRG